MWKTQCDKCNNSDKCKAKCNLTNSTWKMQKVKFNKCNRANAMWQMQLAEYNVTNATWQKLCYKCNGTNAMCQMKHLKFNMSNWTWQMQYGKCNVTLWLTQGVLEMLTHLKMCLPKARDGHYVSVLWACWVWALGPDWATPLGQSPSWL